MIGKEKLQFPVVRDEFGVVRSRYGIPESSLPLTVVLDGEGRLFAVGQPPAAGLDSAVAGEPASADQETLSIARAAQNTGTGLGGCPDAEPLAVSRECRRLRP